MKVLDEVASLFSADSVVVESSEDNSRYKRTYRLPSLHTPNASQLEFLLAKFPQRDDLRLIVKMDSLEDSVLSSRSYLDVNIFSTEIDNKLEFKEDDDQFELVLSIDKGVCSRSISVYSIVDLVEFWKAGGVVSTLKKVEDLMRRAPNMMVFGAAKTTRTNGIVFCPFDATVGGVEKSNNVEYICNQRDKVAHFSNSSQYSFIPDDFFIQGHDCLIDKHVKPLFQNLLLVSSLVYICDFSKFDDLNNVHLRLGGYRLFSRDIDKDEDFSGIDSEYYDIYRWAYCDGDVIDKLGLARNIISLHLDNDDLLSLQKGTLQSISSGYQIYLKDNVKQYIEIKNKLSEFIQSSSDKANDISKNVGGYYKNSIWTMYSFFVSVFLIRVISKNDQTLVTNEIYVLFFAFLVITVIIMEHALRELEGDKTRFVRNYESLKSRYCDLLIPEDLNRILESDKQHNEDVMYIDSKKTEYRKLWGMSLGTIFIVVSILWLVKL